MTRPEGGVGVRYGLAWMHRLHWHHSLVFLLQMLCEMREGLHKYPQQVGQERGYTDLLCYCYGSVVL